MADSIYRLDKKLIFSETFENESSVRRNGGVPSGVTFSNGTATFTAGYITYPLLNIIGATFSLYFKQLKITTLATSQGLLGERNAISMPRIWIHTNGKLYIGGRNLAGAYSNYTFSINTYYDILITTVTGRHFLLYINGIYIETIDVGAVATPFTFKQLMAAGDNSNPLSGSINIIEVYNYALTAQEVWNISGQ